MFLTVDGGVTYGLPLSNGSAIFNLGVLTAGNHNLSASFAAQGAFDTSSATSTITITQATPVITWPTSAPITYGTALSVAQLDASANVPGSFAYLPGMGTVLSAGNQTLSATFTPTDTTDYSSARAQVTLVVQPAGLTITGPAVSRQYGQPNPPLNNVTYSGFVNGDKSSSLSGTLNCTSTATQTSPAGTYPITCSGPHYSFLYVSGTLKIQYAMGPGVVSSFFLTAIGSGTAPTTVESIVDTNNPDTSFRWDSTNQQWIFNISTANLTAGDTYIYTITLNDGSTIMFQYGLR